MLKEIRINKKPTIKVNKDNSKENDYFVNCRSCDDYIYKNRNPIDWRYCDECPANDKKVIKCKKWQ